MVTHKRVILYPYSMGSDGCKRVASNLTTLEVECLRVFGNRDYHPREGDFIMGWGAGGYPEWWDEIERVKCTFINKPKEICTSVSKLESFAAFERGGIPTPKWTRNQAEAVRWSQDGKWVCCRQSVEGMDGAGLILAKTPAAMDYARLYTEYVPNDHEYRIYVFDGKIIDTLEKFPDDDATNEHIRTEANHYIYQRVYHVPQAALDAAIGATTVIGLTFAGVDLVLGRDGRCYVLETNTAPGIGQLTAKRIALAIREKAGL